MGRAKNTPDDFWPRVDTSAGEDGCWLWTGTLSTAGYGYFWIDGKGHPAHRYAYERMVGPIPYGLTLDHTCHNDDKTCLDGSKCLHRRCVNPAHLVPETLSQNRQNSARPRPHAKFGTEIHPAPTQCPQGHPYTEENTGWVERRGHRERYCKACNREKVYRAKHGVDRPAEWNESLSRAGTPTCRRGHAYDEGNTKYDLTTGKRRCRKCEAINARAANDRKAAKPVEEGATPTKG